MGDLAVPAYMRRMGLKGSLTRVGLVARFCAVTTLVVLPVVGYRVESEISQAPADDEGGARVSVTKTPATEPARAAIDWFVPMLAGNPGFEELVATELEDAVANGIGDRFASAKGPLRALRRELVRMSLPDVAVGIPYVESRLRPEPVSPQCAGGYWQFLPEVAVNLGLRVENCVIEGSTELFSPGSTLPSRGKRAYLGESGCLIQSCEVDERLDFNRSTAAAGRYLKKMAREPLLAKHPQQVPLTVLAYHSGLGAVLRLLETTGGDAFSVVSACATGDCLILESDSAWYVPRVVATAALVACNGADPGVPDLSDWARSDLCRTFHEAGMAPEPTDAAGVLAAIAHRSKPWRVGLAAVEVDGYGLEAERQAILTALAESARRIDGIELHLGVPGAEPEALFDEGAEVVLQGRVGRRRDRVWLRVERWEGGYALPVSSAFVLLDPDHIERSEADALLADALLRPVRDRQAETILGLVESRDEELVACLPAIVPGQDEASIEVSLRLDAHGVPEAVATRPSLLPQTAIECLESHLSAIRFPRELQGAGATLSLSVMVEAVAAADSDTE